MGSATAPRSYRLGARAAAMRETRTRILEAALALWYAHWYDEVTLADIARRAGVSTQTVINHFGTKEALVEAVVDWLEPRVRSARRAPVGDLGRIVTVLFNDYEVQGDATVRWNAEAERVPAIARMLARVRAGHRVWLGEVFADRLPRTGAARERAIDLHYAATDVHLWKLWRRDFGLSREAAEDRMRALLQALDNRRTKE